MLYCFFQVMKQKFTTMLLVTILVLGMGLVQAQDQSEIDKLLNQTKVLQEQLDSFKEKEFTTLTGNADKFFLLVMGIVVFLMQCGFAFLEAGAVRSKNTVNILIKNMLDLLIAGKVPFSLFLMEIIVFLQNRI